MSESGESLPNLSLVLFEGAVVSAGALTGILFAPRLLPDMPPLLMLGMPAPIVALIWLVIFCLVGWLGWRIHEQRPNGAAMLVWAVMLVCLILWRVLLYGFGVFWIGAGMLVFAAMLAITLSALIVPIGVYAAWVCLPLVVWIGFLSAGLVLTGATL